MSAASPARKSCVTSTSEPGLANSNPMVGDKRLLTAGPSRQGYRLATLSALPSSAIWQKTVGVGFLYPQIG